MSDANRDSLIAHIEGLQGVLRRRNETIKELAAKLAEPVDLSAAAEKKVAAAYLKGWKDAYRTVQQLGASQYRELMNGLYEKMESKAKS